MERLTEKITNKETGQVLAYRVPANKTIKAAKKLGELEDLEEKGLLLKLPCKPGDTVYRISDHSSYVTSCYIDGIAECTSIEGMRFIVYIDPDEEDVISLSDFGKTVFLTEEEANVHLRKSKLS